MASERKLTKAEKDRVDDLHVFARAAEEMAARYTRQAKNYRDEAAAIYDPEGRAALEGMVDA